MLFSFDAYSKLLQYITCIFPDVPIKIGALNIIPGDSDSDVQGADFETPTLTSFETCVLALTFIGIEEQLLFPVTPEEPRGGKNRNRDTHH